MATKYAPGGAFLARVRAAVSSTFAKRSDYRSAITQQASLCGLCNAEPAQQGLSYCPDCQTDMMTP